MREQPPQYLPSVAAAAAATLSRRQPCELFVPRVKESRLCSVCGFTLIDHNVEPVHYHIPSSLSGNQNSIPSSGLQHSKSAETSSKGHFIEDEYQSLSASSTLIPNCMVYSTAVTPSPIYMTA